MAIFKPHIQALQRYQTSLGRNLSTGLRLDRNERVAPFSPELMRKIWDQFNGNSLSASPESGSLYQSISEQLDISPEMIFVLPGITEGIRVLYDFCTQPGDNVVCLEATYPMYKIYAGLYQVEYRGLTFDEKTLTPKIHELEQLMDDRTRFFFLPNPNLPIESCFTLKEVSALAVRCAKKNVTLVVDEAYLHFGGPNCQPLLKEHKNLIIMRTFSKSYGLAGLRIGFMLGQPEMIRYVSKSRSIVESNTLSMGIAEYLLNHPEHRDQYVRETREGSEYLRARLTQMGFKFQGGLYTNALLMFLKSKEEAQKLTADLKAENIYIRTNFEAPIESTVRVSLGPTPYMKIFADALEKWSAR